MRPIPILLASVALLAGCSEAAPPPGAPGITLPADMAPLNCANFEPPPVAKPAEKFTVRRCADPDGKIRWIAGFFQCTDGKIWPVLANDQPTGAPDEPADPAFATCVGRQPPPPAAPAAVTYKNCDEAKAAGAAPIRRGEPGYRPSLDRDGDGVACDK